MIRARGELGKVRLPGGDRIRAIEPAQQLDGAPQSRHLLGRGQNRWPFGQLDAHPLQSFD